MPTMKRLSKRSRAVLIVVASLLVMAATIPAAIWLTHTRSAETGHARLLCEQHNQSNHVTYLGHDAVMPAMLSARRCDTLRVINLDSQSVSVAIFSSGREFIYDGAASRTLAPQQQVTITLTSSGNYTFGVLQASARALLTVTP